MPSSKNFTKEEVLDAIKGTGGIITQIAQKLRTDWHTAKKYVNKWNHTKVAYQAEIEIMADKAEGNVFQDIWDGDTGTSKWYLLNKAKSRGYGDQEDEATAGQAIDLEKLAKSWLKVNTSAKVTFDNADDTV